MRDGWAYELPTPALRTPGSGSSLLPTPAAMNPNDGEGVQTWQARRERVKATGVNGNGFGTPLSIAVQLLPTPRASDGEKGGPNQRGSKGDLTISSAVQLLPTPRTTDMNGTGGHGMGGLDLRTAVMPLLPTPTAAEGVKGNPLQSSAVKGESGQVWLTNVAHDLAVLNGENTDPRSGDGRP